jgi:hypothetical protein
MFITETQELWNVNELFAVTGVHKAMPMKSSVVWHHVAQQKFIKAEDGNSSFLNSCGKFLPDYRAPHRLRKQLHASFHKTWLNITVQIYKHCAIAQKVKRPVRVS